MYYASLENVCKLRIFILLFHMKYHLICGWKIIWQIEIQRLKQDDDHFQFTFHYVLYFIFIHLSIFFYVILKIFNFYFIAKYLSICHEPKFNSLSEMIDFIQQRVPFPVNVEISIQTIEISSGCKTSDGMFHRWYM